MSRFAPKLRTTPLFMAASPPTVDRDNLILRNVVAMQAGIEAMWDRGFMADSTTLRMMAALGNARSRGVIGHFGHIAMSENAAGKKIMRATNFRVSGDRLVHDVQLLEAARKSPVYAQDPIDYILTMADESPGEIAESVVVLADAAWVMPDGTELDAEKPDEWGDDVARQSWRRGWRPTEALNEVPALRPIRFYSVDIVGDGALTPEGLFDAQAFGAFVEGTSSQFANQLFTAMDEFRAEYGVGLDELPGKLTRTLGVYMQSRGYEGSVQMDNEQPQGEQAPVEAATEAPETDELDIQDVADAVAAAAEPAPEPEPAEEGNVDRVAELEAQVVALEAQVEASEAVMSQMVGLVKQLATTVVALKADVAEMNGEVVETRRVPTAPRKALRSALPAGAQGFDASLNDLGLGDPTSVEERLDALGGTLPSNPALNPLLASQQRRGGN